MTMILKFLMIFLGQKVILILNCKPNNLTSGILTGLSGKVGPCSGLKEFKIQFVFTWY